MGDRSHTRLVVYYVYFALGVYFCEDSVWIAAHPLARLKGMGWGGPPIKRPKRKAPSHPGWIWRNLKKRRIQEVSKSLPKQSQTKLKLHKLLPYFEWVIPTLTHYSDMVLYHLEVNNANYLWHIQFIYICSDILSVLSGILSGIYSDILFGIYSGIHSGILSGIYSDILSDILSGSVWHFIWHMFWHSVWRYGVQVQAKT